MSQSSTENSTPSQLAIDRLDKLSHRNDTMHNFRTQRVPLILSLHTVVEKIELHSDGSISMN